jgi:16S rRNA (cytidine1402-2'-O)-methyltransferase
VVLQPGNANSKTKRIEINAGMGFPFSMTAPHDKDLPRARKPEAERMEAGLYLVATPIGNLEDITLRALSTLRRADVIACEDTRVSLKLMNAYEIKVPLIAYQLKRGGAVVLISDAGTPLLSDPGYKLVQAAVEEGVAVTAIPGASALLTGLSVAGLPMERFFFAGFLPPKAAARKSALRVLKTIPSTLVFYEAPQRVAESLASMKEVLGDRPAAVARELTKKFETVERGRLSELAKRYENDPPRGEIVIIVGPPEETEVALDDLDEALETAIKETTVKEAVARLSAARGLPRRVVYARALALTGKHK